MNAPRDLARYVLLDETSERSERIVQAVSARLERPSPRSPKGLAMALALSAALALAFVAGRYAPHAAQPTGWAGLETAGDPVNLELHDGSRVRLAAQTRVALHESGTARVELELDRGHVDCDVAHVPERRFVVKAADYDVLVRGTQFAVELSPQKHELMVDVRSGWVEVYWRGRRDPEVGLHAGQRWSVALRDPLIPASTVAAAPRPIGVPAPSQTERVPDAPKAPPSATSSDAGPEGTPARVPLPAPPPPRAPARAQAPQPSARAAPNGGARELLDQGNAARRDGDVVGATRAYERLLATYPSDARAGLAAFELGRLRMDRLDDARGAVAPLEQAAKLASDPGLREDAMARLVRAFERLGDKERCFDARAAYLQEHPIGVHVRTVAEACGVGAK
jgi:hypothetical protein